MGRRVAFPIIAARRVWRRRSTADAPRERDETVAGVDRRRQHASWAGTGTPAGPSTSAGGTAPTPRRSPGSALGPPQSDRLRRTLAFRAGYHGNSRSGSYARKLTLTKRLSRSNETGVARQDESPGKVIPRRDHSDCVPSLLSMRSSHDLAAVAAHNRCCLRTRLSHKPNGLYEFDNGCFCRPRDSGSGGQSSSSAAEKAHRRIVILSQTHKKVRPAMVCATASAGFSSVRRPLLSLVREHLNRSDQSPGMRGNRASRARSLSSSRGSPIWRSPWRRLDHRDWTRRR